MKNKEVQESLRQVGIRLIEEPPLLSPEPMSSPEAAVRVLGEWLSEMDRELFCVVNLNSNLMSNAQTMKTAVHETAHTILHDRDIMQENGVSKDRTTKEVEALYSCFYNIDLLNYFP